MFAQVEQVIVVVALKHT